MSYSFEIYSHENKLLKDHLKNVGELSKRFIENLPIEDKNLLSNIAYLMGISHDFAKATTYFQKKLKSGEDTEKADHSALSSLFSFWIIKKVLEKEKLLKNNQHLPVFGCMAVAKHHGNLENFNFNIENLENNYHIFLEQINNIENNTINKLSDIYKYLLEPLNIEVNMGEFLKNIDKIINEIKNYADNLDLDLEKYFEFLLLYSSLIDADRIDASCKNDEEFEWMKSHIFQRIENLDSDMVDDYKKYFLKDKKEINNLRESAYKEVIKKLNKINLDKHKLFSLELPTGMGKTLTAFSFALKLRKKIQRHRGYTPRIIYSLPFLSIIDQNSEIIKEILVKTNISYKNYLNLSEEDKNKYKEKIPSNIFIKHHHLSDIKYITNDSSEGLKEFEKDKALLLIDGWYSEMIVTTFVQLFESLITNKNRSVKKIHNMVGSIIILDEFQSLPYEYWELTKQILQFLSNKWNCYIIMMTATMPKIFDESEVFSLIESPEKYFENENLNRYTLSIDMKKITLEEFFERIFSKCVHSKENILIVVNTIKCSQQLYKMTKEKLKKLNITPKKITAEGIAEYDNFYLVILNSNVIPYHRLQRIEKIRNSKKRKIIISTQLIEAGVDIDVDIVFRDFSPIDSIVQSAGRCNRNNENEKGNVFIIRLVDKNGKTFSKRIYGHITEDITEELLENVNVLEEKDLRKYVEKHFDKNKHRSDIKKFLNEVSHLKFSEISEFSLIKEEFGKEDVCICFNPALETINEIKKKKREVRNVSYREKFKILAEIRDLRKKLENFIISPRIKNMDDIFPYQPDDELWKMRIVYPNEAKNIYDFEMGFILSHEDFENRIL